MSFYLTVSLGFGFACSFAYLIFSKDKDIHKTISYASIGALAVGGLVIGGKLILQMPGYPLDATDSEISDTLFTMLIALMWVVYTFFLQKKDNSKGIPPP